MLFRSGAYDTSGGTNDYSYDGNVTISLAVAPETLGIVLASYMVA